MTNDQDRPASQSEAVPVRSPVAGQADNNDATPGQTGLLLELMREMRFRVAPARSNRSGLCPAILPVRR